MPFGWVQTAFFIFTGLMLSESTSQKPLQNTFNAV